MPQLDQKTMMRLAAYLCATEHLKEKQIGWKLGGISQPTVSRLLKMARAEHLIERSVSYRYTGEELSLSNSEELLLETLEFQSKLHTIITTRLSALGQNSVPKVYLYDLRSEGGVEVPLESRLHSFARRIVPKLCGLLTRPIVKTIGVAWGSVVETVVSEMDHHIAAPRVSHPITVIATCGEPLDNRSTNESSSAIAERLSEVLNGSRIHAKTLGITPAYLPSISHANGAEWIWRYILASKPYVEVFGTEHLSPDTKARIEQTQELPLCDSIDVFLTSVSMEGGTAGYGNNRLYPNGVITPEELDRVAYGDMGGIPLPRPGLDQAQEEILKRMKESWTGISREQVKNCVSRGFDGHPTSRPPGCILLAAGKNKARTVYQAVVKERLVNHLFIDYECAEELAKLLNGHSASS